MADRLGPEAGYDFGNKRQYRREIWRALAEWCKVPSIAQCLLMPSIEGDEIEEAIRHGFAYENLHVVDKNPAIVATLKRRFPRIRTYGVDVVVAAERIAEERRRDEAIGLDVANLDLCACVGESLIETVRRFAASGALNELSLVSVTALRGREQRDCFECIREFAKFSDLDGQLDFKNKNDWGRLYVIRSAIQKGLAIRDSHPAHLWLFRSGMYKSVAGSQTMLWGIFKIHPSCCFCEECQLIHKEHLESRGFSRLIPPTELENWLSGVSGPSVKGGEADVLIAEYREITRELEALAHAMHPRYRGLPDPLKSYGEDRYKAWLRREATERGVSLRQFLIDSAVETFRKDHPEFHDTTSIKKLVKKAMLQHRYFAH